MDDQKPAGNASMFAVLGFGLAVATTAAIGAVPAAISAGTLAVLWIVWAWQTDNLPAFVGAPDSAAYRGLPPESDFV